MEKYRNLANVIDQMLEICSDSAINYELKKIRESFLYSSPEMKSFWWNKTALYLQKNINKPNVDCHKKMVKIFTTKDSN